MNRQAVVRTNQSSKSDTPLVSGILQRAAVRSISETEMQPQEDTENSTWQESRFHYDFSQVPAYSTTPIVQPKLTIGAVGDKYEQEADRVARQVVSQIHAPGNQTVQREEMSDEESDLMVQRQSDGGGMAATPELEASIQQARGSGQPLSENIRKPMEQAFGADFSRVKVHADAQSEQMNRSIHAKAFTTGQDIFFRQGVYSPGSRGGQELIAHELTHVVQQNGSIVQNKTEKEAQSALAVSTFSSAYIHRQIVVDNVNDGEPYDSKIDFSPQYIRAEDGKLYYIKDLQRKVYLDWLKDSEQHRFPTKLALINALQTESLFYKHAEEMEKLGGIGLKWRQSSNPKMPPALGKNIPFYQWLMQNGEEPKTMNCWEAVLYAAFKGGLIDKSYIVKAVTLENDRVLGFTTPRFAKRIIDSPEGQVRNDTKAVISLKEKTIPRGRVVLFGEEAQHVALSTGKQRPFTNPHLSEMLGVSTGHGLCELDKFTSGESTVEDTIARNTAYAVLISWGPLPPL